jgi:hypothetical protein
MQQINLYQDEFRTPKDPISAVLIGQIIAGSLAVVIAVAAVTGLIGWRAAVAAQGVKGEVAALTDQSRSLAAELRARDQGAFFAESVQHAERQLASSETIRAFLGQLQRHENESFSIIFKDLARTTVSGLRLTVFEFSAGGEVVELTGEALSSDLVPRFVKGLEQSESGLSERAFSSRILQNESEVYRFELSTLVSDQ